MGKFSDAAYKILSSKKIAMRPKEIVDIILAEKLIETKSVRPEATLNSILQKDKRFIKNKAGFWTIK